MKKVLLLLLLCGCAVGPDYHRPETAMPTKFIEAERETELSSSTESMYHWWKQLGDPFLDRLLEEAAVANFDLRIAVERIYQARAQYRVQRSYLWPEIDINAIATRTRNSQNFFQSQSTTPTSATGTTTTTGSILPVFQNFFLLGFDAIWEFDFFGKFRRSKKAAYYQWEAAIEEVQNVLISVLSEVARTYVSICSLQQKIELTQQKIRVDEEELALSKSLFDAGLNSELPFDSLLATLESDKSTLPVLETALKQEIYALALLLGRQPETLVTEFEQIRPIPIGLDKVPIGLPSDLLRRRPDIKQAERELAAATEQIGVAVADLFPHISLTGSTFSGGQLAGSTYGYESGTLHKLFDLGSRTWSIGPSIRWDILDFGRTRGNIAVQTSLQKQALLTYEQTVIASLQDVEGALVAYFEEQRRNLFLKAQVDADKRSLQLNEDLFRSGLASESAILEARKVVLDSENSLIDSEQALTSDLIALYKALGGDWE